jgi:anthranilate phosphoribosyltransferase
VLPPDEAEHPFAPYVRTLGRGPGHSRALSQEEARDAFGMILRGETDPHQTGAFLMLLRYRGEDADGMAWLVEAARAHLARAPEPIGADLDWPSYGAGRTRGAPWFLLSALALGQAGYRVLMHGSNAHSQGVPVPDALRLLGWRPAESGADAARLLRDTGFAYLPLASLSSTLDRLLGLRALLGLRSPVNTVARLLNPFDAEASVDGVFHPPYIDLHLGTAQRLGRARLLVVKGGGGEAERNPARPIIAHLLAGASRHELHLPPLATERPEQADFLETWREETAQTPTVIATIALGLLALGASRDVSRADLDAASIWRARKR